jgi:hypothetical protein
MLVCYADFISVSVSYVRTLQTINPGNSFTNHMGDLLDKYSMKYIYIFFSSFRVSVHFPLVNSFAVWKLEMPVYIKRLLIVEPILRKHSCIFKYKMHIDTSSRHIKCESKN